MQFPRGGHSWRGHFGLSVERKGRTGICGKYYAGGSKGRYHGWSPNGQLIALQMQHTSIALDEIERHAGSYARAGIAQIWIPFIEPSVWRDGHNRSLGEFFVEKYPPRHFERWVHGFNGKNGMWMYDPAKKRVLARPLGGTPILRRGNKLVLRRWRGKLRRELLQVF